MRRLIVSFLTFCFPVFAFGETFCRYSDAITTFLQDSFHVNNINEKITFYVSPTADYTSNSMIHWWLDSIEIIADSVICCDLNNCSNIKGLNNYVIEKADSIGYLISDVSFSDIYINEAGEGICATILSFYYRRYMLYLIFLIEEKEKGLSVKCVYRNFTV